MYLITCYIYSTAPSYDQWQSDLSPPLIELDTEIQQKVEKLIQPGGHTNIPGPNSRMGPDGSYGYIHDPKFLSKNPKPFENIVSVYHQVKGMNSQKVLTF